MEKPPFWPLYQSFWARRHLPTRPTLNLLETFHTLVPRTEINNFATLSVASLITEHYPVFIADGVRFFGDALLIQCACRTICEAVKYRFDTTSHWVHDRIVATTCGEPLGEGTFATVCKGSISTEFGPRRTVACKFFHHSEAHEYRQFFREAAILQRLFGVRNVPKLFSIDFPSNDSPCLYMTLGSHNLDRVIQTVKYDGPTVIQWMIELLDCLHEAHSRKVVHRDLKPANIILDETKSHIFIVDWGSGDLDDTDPSYSSTTRWYRAPELWKRERGFPYAGDIWAAGCIFAELCTRQPLFRCLKSDEMDYKEWETILPNRLEFIREHNKTIDPEFLKILSLMLTLQPQDRGTPLELSNRFKRCCK